MPLSPISANHSQSPTHTHTHTPAPPPLQPAPQCSTSWWATTAATSCCGSGARSSTSSRRACHTPSSTRAVRAPGRCAQTRRRSSTFVPGGALAWGKAAPKACSAPAHPNSRGNHARRQHPAPTSRALTPRPDTPGLVDEDGGKRQLVLGVDDKLLERKVGGPGGPGGGGGAGGRRERCKRRPGRGRRRQAPGEPRDGQRQALSDLAGCLPPTILCSRLSHPHPPAPPPSMPSGAQHPAR
jgi:hypothetical protein